MPARATHTFRRTLKHGDFGRDVEVLQEWLNSTALGLGTGQGELPVTGSFKTMTADRVRRFQKKSGLHPTGCYDHRTYRALSTAVEQQEEDPDLYNDRINRWGY